MSSRFKSSLVFDVAKQRDYTLNFSMAHRCMPLPQFRPEILKCRTFCTCSVKIRTFCRFRAWLWNTLLLKCRFIIAFLSNGRRPSEARCSKSKPRLSRGAHTMAESHGVLSSTWVWPVVTTASRHGVLGVALKDSVKFIICLEIEPNIFYLILK